MTMMTMRKNLVPTKTTMLAIWLVIVAFLFCTDGNAAGPKAEPPDSGQSALQIIADPAMALYGTPFSLTVRGLRPAAQATIKAQSTDRRAILWESSAVFKADATGSIDVGQQAPLSGNYSGADIFGLLWSMKPQNSTAKRPPSFADDEVSGWTVDFTVVHSTGKTASARLRRVFQMPDQKLVRIPLEKDGMQGYLYYPAEGGPFPGVMILGGAGGGLFEWLAQAYASNGFAALTLAYFGYRDLPKELVEIPLEYLQQALAWMKAQPAVKADRVGIAGGSKGGELALLLASLYDDYQAVVAWTPSAYAWEGLSQKFFSPDYVPVSSWSLNGQPLPFIQFRYTQEEKDKEAKGELNSYVAPHFRSLTEADPAVIEQATIRVEKIKAPILLVSGTDDQTWPADDFCRSIVAKLQKARFPYEVKHISHEGAGHMSFLPSLITANRGWISGGSPRADAKAGFISWKETIAFLHRHLDR